MSDELQAGCFFAGANSIFYGEKLLTTDNPEADHDRELFQKLGIRPLHTEKVQEEVGELEMRACRCGAAKLSASA